MRKPPAGARDPQPPEQPESSGEIAEVVAVAVVEAKLGVVFVIAKIQKAVAFRFQGFLDQGFQLSAHLLFQLLFKEIFPVFKIQLKMTIAEDF